jgi:hypothetical protein
MFEHMVQVNVYIALDEMKHILMDLVKRLTVEKHFIHVKNELQEIKMVIVGLVLYEIVMSELVQ